MNDPLHPVPLPPGVSHDAVMKLGAAIGQQAAAHYLVNYAGLTGDALRAAEDINWDQIEATHEAWREIETQAQGFGTPLMTEMHRVAAILSVMALAGARQP